METEIKKFLKENLELRVIAYKTEDNEPLSVTVEVWIDSEFIIDGTGWFEWR